MPFQNPLTLFLVICFTLSYTFGPIVGPKITYPYLGNAVHSKTNHKIIQFLAKTPKKHNAVHQMELLIDSGSNVNILDRSTFDRICGDLTLEPVRKDIRVYSSNEPLPIIGRVSTKVTSGSNTISAHFYVADGRYECLLGYETSTELGLIHVANAVTKKVITNAIPKAIILEEVEKATQGITKTKSLLREKVCFPVIAKMTEAAIKQFNKI